jgi:hypothetical protein
MIRIRTRRRPIKRAYAAAKDAAGGIKKKTITKEQKGQNGKTKRIFYINFRV